MNETIFLRLKLSVDDYVRCLRFMQSQLFINKYGFLIAPLIIFLAIFSIIFVLANDKSNINPLSALILSLAPSIIIGVVIYSLDRFITPFLLKRNISKQYESSPALREEQIISFTKDGIENSNSLASSKISWEAVVKAVESETDLLFYTTNKFAHFIPKHAFSSEFDINQLRALARVKLGDKAKL